MRICAHVVQFRRGVGFGRVDEMLSTAGNEKLYLVSDASSFVTGDEISVSGGMQK